METRFATAFEQGSDGQAVGERAGERVLTDLETDRVDFWHAIVSTEFDYEAVLWGIRSVLGEEAQSMAGTSPFGFAGEADVSGGESGVFAGENGVSLAALTSDTLEINTAVAECIPGDATETARSVLEHLPQKPSTYSGVLELVDGFVGNIEELTLRIHQRFGSNATFAGAAAGPDLETLDPEKAIVSANATVAEEGIAIGAIESDKPVPVAIDHGHEPLSGPHTITDADANLIKEIDGRQAHEVWTEAVREAELELTGVDVTALDVDDVELQYTQIRYGLGIDQGSGFKVRGIGAFPPTPSGWVFSVVQIPEGSDVYVMETTPTAQIESTKTVARKLQENATHELAGALVYDCACRWFILDDEYSHAIEEMNDLFDVPMGGCVAAGEICMQPGDLSGYHNETTVAVGLPR